MAKYQEDDVVLCTVKRIEKTTVFLELEDGSEGTMILAEVSPGRIRNIREYVSPNKKVVCKILRIKGDHIELSLRRVRAGERDEVLERHKKEKVFQSILKPILKDKTQKVIEKISQDHEIADFLDDARENPELITKYVPKENLEQIKKILAEKREKEKSANKTIKITTQSESGINEIKEILETDKAEVYYLGSSRFSIETSAKDYKTANNELEDAIESIKEKAKKLHAKIEIK